MNNKLNQVEQRKLILETVEQDIGATPLYEIWPGEKLLRGNRIFAKAENQNPTGSHYDRVFLKLFRSLDFKTDNLIEVSSGNAGASFSWFCRLLHYNSVVVLPAEVPQSFHDHIKSFNPDVQIITSPYQGRYVEGAVAYMRELFEGDFFGSRTPFLMNHSRRSETLLALQNIAKETITQLHTCYGEDNLDHFIAACGNGASIIGPGRTLKQQFKNLVVTVFEPEEAPVASKTIGTSKPANHNQLHNLYGTGAFGVKFPFIEKPSYGFSDLVTTIRTINSAERNHARTLRAKLPISAGTTSLVSLHLALKIIEETGCEDKNFLIILYDRGDKYDGI